MAGLADFLALFVPGRRDEPLAVALPAEVRCPSCDALVSGTSEYQTLRICPNCRYHFALPAIQRIEAIVDPGTFKELNRRLNSGDPLGFADKLPYPQRIANAQRQTGLTEAVVTGSGRIAGRPMMVGAMDFNFLGGSMGSVVGEKIARLFETATRAKAPVIIFATSGGARMQEGILSLMQMAKTVAAAKRHQAAGLPFISVLANPTTGGIYASFANLGDIIIAEPNALIGFAGPRVIEETTGEKLPPGAQRSEFQRDHGQVDLIIDRAKLRDTLSSLLGLMSSPYKLTATRQRELPAAGDTSSETAWQQVQLARRDDRPTALAYMQRMTNNLVLLSGDRLYGDDPAIVGGLAELAGQSVVILGHERSHNGGRARPEGYRKAKRLMLLAAKLQLPIVTLIDTPGAYPGLESEERGLAGSLADCLATMIDLPTPIISVIIGEGGSGGALAIGLADRVLMQEHAIYSVIAPEGAAAIIYHSASRAEELAASLRCTAHDCKALGVVHSVVPEPTGGAHIDPDAAARIVKATILHEMVQLRDQSAAKLVKKRYDTFRRMGEVGAPFQDALAREIAWLQSRVPHRTEPIPTE